MKGLLPISSSFIKSIQIRTGETKLGEKAIIHGRDTRPFEQKSRFIILGIPEDIGPRANGGRGGAFAMWDVFLPRFLNMQSNEFLAGEKVLIAGTIDCSEEMKASVGKEEGDLRQLTERIDQKVAEVLTYCFQTGGIPIVIGGGHNNAYAILKAASMYFDLPIAAINIDPHADIRPIEGRHSGNGFSYALKEGFLGNYFALGLHECFNSSYIMNQFSANDKLHYCTFDDHIRGKLTINEAVQIAVNHTKGQPTGLELDLDSIAGFPTSAQTECGWTPDQARELVWKIASKIKPIYIHYPEGAPEFDHAKASIHGKTLAYLVSDFIKAHLSS